GSAPFGVRRLQAGVHRGGVERATCSDDSAAVCGAGYGTSADGAGGSILGSCRDGPAILVARDRTLVARRCGCRSAGTAALGGSGCSGDAGSDDWAGLG